MNNIALGQYVDKNSIIHKLDPRTKVIALIFFMIGIFLIPSPLQLDKPWMSFVGLGFFMALIILVILLTKISIIKFVKSVKQIIFLLLFTFTIQVLSPSTDRIVIFNVNLQFSVLNIILAAVILVAFIIFRKYLKAKLLLFVIIIALDIYILNIPMGNVISTYNLQFYRTGLFTGAFFSLRVFLVLLLSTILSLTTKPTDLTSALEWILHPLTFLKLNVSIFAMMISIALRFIPTLFNETQKILKAQSARGVDFAEGTIKSQISQIISLLIPMFVVSFKRAADLADAMEARCYIPGAKRTKINIMTFKIKDYLCLLFTIIVFTLLIVWKVLA